MWTNPPTEARILWVEDEPHTLKFEACLLQERGVSVRWATTIAEATAAVGEERYDLIVLDCMLSPAASDERPIEAGVRFLETIRDGSTPRGPNDKDIPVLVLTAVPNRSILSSLSELGVVRTVAKPAFAEEICDAIGGVLKDTNQEPETAQQDLPADAEDRAGEERR